MPNHVDIDEVSNFQLLDGGLLMWDNIKNGSNGHGKDYILLK
jgi:hypothetical protein